MFRKLAIAAAVAATTLLATVGARADTVLRMSNWVPLGHPLYTDVLKPWTEDVARLTNGRVTVEIAPKVVGTVPTQFDVVRDGLADVVYIVAGYTPGRFPLVELGELPFITDDAQVGATAFYRFYEKYLAPLDVYKGVHTLSTFTTSAGQIYTVKKQIKTIDDLKGLKLRSPLASTMPTIEALGAVPVLKPVSELYEMLSTGVLDGTMSQKEQGNSYKLADVTQYLTLIPGGTYNSVMALLINQDKWDSIDKADQEAIMSVSGEAFAEKIGRAFDKGDQGGIEAMKKAGRTIETASPELVAAMKQALEPIEAQALEKARASGLADPAAALADYRADVARATAERKKQAAQ